MADRSDGATGDVSPLQGGQELFGGGEEPFGMDTAIVTGSGRFSAEFGADSRLSNLPVQMKGSRVLGVGVDLVKISEFAEQLSTPGSQFAEPGMVFSSRELRRAHARAGEKGDAVATHLAAVWALKEAVLKAWLNALATLGEAAPLRPNDVVWPDIGIRHALDGAPSVVLSGEMAQVFATSVEKPLGSVPVWHVSATHDGDYALAFVVMA